MCFARIRTTVPGRYSSVAPKRGSFSAVFAAEPPASNKSKAVDGPKISRCGAVMRLMSTEIPCQVWLGHCLWCDARSFSPVFLRRLSTTVTAAMYCDGCASSSRTSNNACTSAILVIHGWHRLSCKAELTHRRWSQAVSHAYYHLCTMNSRRIDHSSQD